MVGHAMLHTEPDAAPMLEVLDIGSGQIVARATAQLDPGTPRLLHFRIALPAATFDGRPHGFSVRMAHDFTVLQSVALAMPLSWTPEAALLKYAREGMLPSLSTLAGFRYQALVNALDHLSALQEGKGDQESTRLVERIRQISVAHKSLVRGSDELDQVYEPLHFPMVKKPRVSIVIPVHNKFHFTYHCLASLLLAANRASFEVIVVNDGSSPEQRECLEKIKGISVLHNQQPQGFIRACNRGAQLARGEFVVMLNNDTEVTAGWIDELLWIFDHFDNVGMVGSKLLYPDGTLQEAGGVVWNNGNPINYGRNGNPHDPRFTYTRQTDYLSGASMMLPMHVWKEIGGFSEEYVPAYFEDTDLAFRVRSLNLKTVYAPFSEVVHFEGASNGTNVLSGVKKFQEINRPKFKRNWIAACRGNGKEGVDLELNKDRNVQFRCLVIDAQIPMPDKDAGSYAAVQEIRMLQALGFKCTFVPQNLAWMGEYTRSLQRMGVECLHAPYFTSFDELLAQRGREFDLVYVTRYYVAQSCIEMVRKFAPQAKLILNNADLHFLRELRSALQTGSTEAVAQSLLTRDAELSTMRQVDLVLCYTDVEKAVIQSHNLDLTKIARCPWVAPIAQAVPGFKDRKDIAFLGGFGHAPNVEAVEWFEKHVLPELANVLPGVKVRIYGSRVPRSLIDLAKRNENLVIEGWVADVAQVYDTCRVFIAPLQSGAGIKGKVIGALANGVPSVLSPVAAEGIPVADGTDAYVATSVTQWVKAIEKLYSSEATWSKISARSIAFAKAQYGFERGVAEMKDALQQVDIFATESHQSLVSR